MAKTVLELAVGTGQWDAGLKKAKSALDNFVSAQGGLKNALDQDSEKVRTFVQMMGRMESQAKTVKGQMNEYKAVIEQLTMQYAKLTDEQKKTIGQDYLKSIDQLKAKYKDAKGELDELNKSLGDTSKESKEAGSALDVLTNKFGISTKSMLSWGTALAAGKAALDVAKDAFFASEQNLDDWNRTVYSAQSAYQGFLTAINTGDISGFLQNIDNIVAAATAAYNAMDALSTQRAINNAPMQAQMTENQRFRTMLQTRRWISAADGRDSGGMKNGQVLTDAQLQKIERMLENGMKTLNSYTQKEIQATTAAIEALYEEQAQRLGMTKEQFLAGTQDYETFKANLEGANAYRNIEAQKNYLRSLANSGQSLTAAQSATLNQRNQYEQYKAWGVFKDDGELFNTINQYINQRAGLQQQYYGQLQQGYRAINRVEGISNRGGTRGGTADKMVEGGIKGVQDMGVESIRTTESMRELQAQLAQFTQALATATNAADARAAQAGIAQTQRRIGAQANALRLGISTDSMLEMEDEVKAFAEELKKKMPRLEFTVSGNITSAAKEAKAGWTEAARAIQSVGGALQTIEDPAAKIAGIVGQAIANIALGFATATAKDSKFGVFGWIAAVAGGLATMVSTIAAIKSATAGSYEQGGIVPGNSYHGDHLTAAVNSGELILNRAQQNNLAAQLLPPIYDESAKPRIMLTGDKLFLAINNYLKATNKGQLVTSK